MNDDVRHVRVCANDVQLVRADRIITVFLGTTGPMPAKAVDDVPGELKLSALIQGDLADGTKATSTVLLATWYSGPARWQVMVEFADAVSLAAKEPRAAFVYPFPRENGGITWEFSAVMLNTSGWPGTLWR
jgi:hypothetical protein